MSKRARRDLTGVERDVLAVLWELERATAREVAEALADSRGWAYSTAKTVLDRMMAREIVLGRRVGNVWEYRAALKPLEANRGAWVRFVEGAFGGATGSALHFIVKDAKLTKKQRDTLRRLLDEED
jgi:BlaI family transcriptional regulator, penicillinase repressor